MGQAPLQTSLKLITVWWTACLLWSSTFLLIRLGLQEIPPFTFASLRLAIALSVLAPLAFADGRWRSLAPREVLHIALAGVLLLGANYALVFWGAQFVASGLVAILQSGTPVLALLFGWMLGSERVTGRKILALACGFVGVVIIFGAEARASSSTAFWGAAAVLAGSTCVALAYVILKSYTRQLSRLAVTATAVQSAAGLVPLVSLAVLFEGRPAVAEWSGAAWAALLYLALGASVLAFWLNYWLLARMDTSTVLVMGVAQVPIAVGLGAVVFVERLPPGILAGGAFVVAGVMAGLSGPVATPPKGGV